MRSSEKSLTWTESSFNLSVKLFKFNSYKYTKVWIALSIMNCWKSNIYFCLVCISLIYVCWIVCSFYLFLCLFHVLCCKNFNINLNFTAHIKTPKNIIIFQIFGSKRLIIKCNCFGGHFFVFDMSVTFAIHEIRNLNSTIALYNRWKVK